LKDQKGQGRSSAGLGNNSKLVTDLVFWRMLVPMQSLPVSPPPMTTTCLPSAEIGGRSIAAGSSPGKVVCLPAEDTAANRHLPEGGMAMA